MKIIKINYAIALTILLYSCLTETEVKLEYNGYQPVQQEDGWDISTPANENMDSSFIEKAYNLIYDDSRFIMARSLLIIRNGRLVGEAYPHSLNDSRQIQNIQSCTKSFTSILTGIALDKGILDSVHQKFSDIYPQYFTEYPDKKDIRIEDALTMRTGINFDDDTHTLDLYQTSGSSVEFILSLPKDYPPGIVFHYNDGAPQLISAAIQQKYGKPLSAFAHEFLFKPLEINDWKWESAKDGITYGAFSLYLKPRDAAKFGQLLLNKGKWNGQWVVDSTWILKSTQPLVTSSSEGASYGYYFRIFTAYQGYSAFGHGGQHIFVVPPYNLVIVYTAWPYTSGEMYDNFTEIADLIIKSCR